jgi:hypothetical protein
LSASRQKLVTTSGLSQAEARERLAVRKALTLHRICVVAFLVGLVIQFLLAGLGVFGAESFGAHRILGDVLILIALTILLTGLVGRMGRAIVRPSALLTGLTIVQVLLILAEDSMPALAALHVVNALAIVLVAQLVAVRTWGLRRGGLALPDRAPGGEQ